MIPEILDLEVVTPVRHILHETVHAVEMPGKNGYLGILPGHAPLITELGIGLLSYHKGGEMCYLTVINGYAEVLPGRVIILAEISERAEEINVERARAARDRARARLAKPDSADMDWDRATFALERALIRLQVAAKGGGAAAAAEEQRHAAP